MVSGADIRRGLPARVGVGIRRASDDAPALAVHPLEDGILGPRAAERRRRSFALGRATARDALAELDIAPVGIGRGPAGEPVWPPGVVGAISHSDDLAVAVVGWRADYAGLGVDVEHLSPGLSARASRLVCTPAEIAWLESAMDSRLLTMLFSAKEAVFKATFPIAGVWLGFGDAELTWHAEQRLFEARLLKDAGRGEPAGSILQVRCTLTATEVLSTTYTLARDVSLPTKCGTGGGW
jgi:enterobactin synthetase component D / holo-[acyl-carrier protein] synthase